MSRPVHALSVVDNLLVRSAGPADAPTLVLLHGLADSGAMFVPLFDTPLAERYRLVAIDMPGFGASPARADVATIGEHARALTTLLEQLVPAGERYGIVAHSIAAMVVTDAAQSLGDAMAGLFSIEGNLTLADAYFSGRAATYDDPRRFQADFVDYLWGAGRDHPILRRYYASVIRADAHATWAIARDAFTRSATSPPGEAFRAVRQPKRYYWGTGNTPEETKAWLADSGIDHEAYHDASHWPTIDAAEATAGAIGRFFDGVLA